MTLQEAKTLHAYNAWATNKLLDAVAEVPVAQYRRDLKSSHGSIHGTLVHIVRAENVWLKRWTGTPDAGYLAPESVSTLADLKTAWEKTGYETAKFLGSATDKKMGETFVMKTTSGETHTHTYAQALQHVVNHSSYHRGQIVTMLRQLGFTPPDTGLIRFFRETAK